MTTSQPQIGPQKNSALVSLWLLLCGFNAAVGTSFLGDWYYVVPGFSWLDALLCLSALKAASMGPWPVVPLPRIAAWHTVATLALSFWLVLATVVNAFWFETYFGDILPPLKLIYLAIVVIMIRRYAALYGVRTLLIGCFAGILTVTVQELAASERVVGGVPLLLNSNVTGALLGLGVWFAVFGLLFTHSRTIDLIAAMLLAALSVTSFSKGAWLMCGFGLLAAFVAAAARRKLRLPRRGWLAGTLLVAALLFSGVLVRDNMAVITRLIDLKLTSTVEGGSAELRADFIVASVRAGFQYPVFGLGYRNFDQTVQMYPDLRLPHLERLDNAHNLFAQTLAVGGIPAAALLGVVFVLPFVSLRRKLRSRLASGPAGLTIWGLSFGVWLVYASVQLQLIANPPFWFFCGLIFGVPSSFAGSKPVAGNAAKANGRLPDQPPKSVTSGST